MTTDHKVAAKSTTINLGQLIVMLGLALVCASTVTWAFTSSTIIGCLVLGLWMLLIGSNMSRRS